MTKKIIVFIAFLTGLGMIFIGARFLLAPESAEAGFGIHFSEQGDYAFHYTKGVRDLFTGLLLAIFALTRQPKALGTTLAVGTIIPIVDLLIVLSKDYTGVAQAMPHISAIIVCFVGGAILLLSKTPTKAV